MIIFSMEPKFLVLHIKVKYDINLIFSFEKANMKNKLDNFFV